MRLYITKRVGEEVDKYLMVKITRILAEKDYEKDTSYLQVFTIANNEIVVEQEQPAKKEHYKISREYEKQKLFEERTCKSFFLFMDYVVLFNYFL